MKPAQERRRTHLSGAATTATGLRPSACSYGPWCRERPNLHTMRYYHAVVRPIHLTSDTISSTRWCSPKIGATRRVSPGGDAGPTATPIKHPTAEVAYNPITQ